MPPSAEVSAVILCGGQGSRMQGRDKGRVLYQGRPLVEWVLQKVGPQVAELCISANRHLDDYRAYGWPVLPDATPDFPGPLAGVNEALLRCATPWLLVVPCDTPHLPDDLVPRLLAASRAAQSGAAYAVDAEREHPVIHLLQRDCLPELSAWREQGGSSVRGFLARLEAVPVFFANPHAFKNVNSAAELDDGS